MILTRQLGLIPDWQFSADPKVNLHLNPYVTFPEGMNQTTPQPVGYDPNWHAPTNFVQPFPNANGLGFLDFFDSWAWRNRKWLVLGGGALAALGVVSLLR